MPFISGRWYCTEPSRELILALQSDDEDEREQAIQTLCGLEDVDQMPITQATLMHTLPVNRCLRLLEAVQRLGVPLSMGSFQDLLALRCHPSPEVYAEVKKLLGELNPFPRYRTSANPDQPKPDQQASDAVPLLTLQRVVRVDAR
jgi:hypothetical protein